MQCLRRVVDLRRRRRGFGGFTISVPAVDARATTLLSEDIDIEQKATKMSNVSYHITNLLEKVLFLFCFIFNFV